MRPIPSFPDYEISEHGIVYSIKKGTKMTQSKQHNKLMTVSLRGMHEGKLKTFQRGVSQLMWETYSDLIGIPEHLEEDFFSKHLSIVVKKKNGCLWDNRVFNLQIADKRKRGHPYCMSCLKFHLPRELCE